MENFRKVEPILTTANTLGLVGAIFYFYRAITALQAEQTKLAQALQSTIDTVGDMKNKDNRGEVTTAIQMLDSNIQNIKRQLDNMATLDDVDELNHHMTLMTRAMKESGIEITDSFAPVYTPPQPVYTPRDRYRAKPQRTRAPTGRQVHFSGVEEEPEDTVSGNDAISMVRARHRRGGN